MHEIHLDRVDELIALSGNKTSLMKLKTAVMGPLIASNGQLRVYTTTRAVKRPAQA